MNVRRFSDAESPSGYVANYIAKNISRKNLKNLPFVLGLSTGKTPLRLYNELIRFHKEEN